MTKNSGGRCALAAVTLVVATATASSGQAAGAIEGAIEDPKTHVAAGDIRAIAAATTERWSGLFVADVEGRIYFHAAEAPIRERTAIDHFGPKYEFLRPLGMAYGDPFLYVFDGETRQIWAIDVWGTEERRPQRFGTEFQRPTHLAVSPHGVVAVLDEGRLILLQEDRDKTIYERSAFPDPSGLVFSTWDTLHVLDRGRGSLVTITFSRHKDGEVAFLSESESLAQPPGGAPWTAMDVFEGVVYLATANTVFARVESALIPVLPRGARFAGIRDIAATRNGLYLKDGGQLALVPRAEPVDLTFESDAATSQAALLELYRYLADIDLLPTREVRASRSYERLDAFLLEQGALIAPAGEAAPEIRFYPDDQEGAYQSPLERGGRSGRTLGSRPQAPEAGWNAIFCSLDRALCSGSAPVAVEQGRKVTIPDLPIERTLSRERILLERPLGSYLDELIRSIELRRLIDPAFLKRLNPELAKLSDEQLYALDRGLVVVPVERWSLTAAVPAVDYDNPHSEPWRIQRRFPGVSLRSRAAFVEQSARSMWTQDTDPDDETAAADACRKARSEMERWWARIRYPFATSTGGLIWPHLATRQVRIGVLEFGTTVLTSHQVFTLDADRPVWHSFNVLSELVPNPDPQTFETGDQVVLDAATFSPEAHHGTHVAGLVAGRRGRCWSGLLPSSRLVLVDLTDRARVQRAVDHAVHEEVKVFNVSQTFAGPQDDLRRTVLGDGRALWVVAAGNEGLDLDALDEALVPAPARWGPAPNVVAVTAADWNGTILEDVDTPEGRVPGVNRGKRYVDLVAPGRDVLSASEQKKYGPASGTSQAAPQVAAAAAMLVDRLGERLTPGDVKARLIATADWTSSYEGKVWGGHLDFGAAVMFPDRNLLRTTTDTQLGRLHAVVAEGDPKIEILNVPRYYERGGEGGETAPDTIRFSRILSLRRRPDGSFRVVLREPVSDHLKILLDARLGDARKPLGGTQRVRCASFEVLDQSTGTFAPDAGCEEGLSIATIDTYVQGGAYQVQWGGRP